MNKDELKKKFYENINYLQRNVPPDDIYIFCEQTFMAAMFFLKQWSNFEDLNAVCEKDPIARKWIVNVLEFHRLKDLNQDVEVDLDLNSLDEEDED